MSTGLDLDKLNRDFAAMEAQLRQQYALDGIALSDVTINRFGDLRYVGQGYELRVPIPCGQVTDPMLATMWRAFHDLHAAEYGHHFEKSPIELVNIRVIGVGLMSKIGRPPAPRGRSLAEARRGARKSVFRVDGVLGEYETAVYSRDGLPIDATLAGPAIILQRDSTTVVPPGWSATADAAGNLIMRRAA
ncbi:MAG: hypothetical protein FJX56_10860 [Alphaproteobacteria bacterium]|nr:hypothetical protein [Alphaproteobacteria bacterium]